MKFPKEDFEGGNDLITKYTTKFIESETFLDNVLNKILKIVEVNIKNTISIKKHKRINKNNTLKYDIH